MPSLKHWPGYAMPLIGLEAENVYLREEVERKQGFDEIVGEHSAVLRCLHQVDQVANTRIPVLILGETGTGKELIARAIHEHSDRRDRPLVKVNCAALPANLIESELFGHEKGAFTSADSKKRGRFDLANGTTLFLDEIGEIPIELQAKLLRVLQEGEFERLGGTKNDKGGCATGRCNKPRPQYCGAEWRIPFGSFLSYQYLSD